MVFVMIFLLLNVAVSCDTTRRFLNVAVAAKNQLTNINLARYSCALLVRAAADHVGVAGLISGAHRFRLGLIRVTSRIKVIKIVGAHIISADIRKNTGYVFFL